MHTRTDYAFEKTANLVYDVLNRVANHRYRSYGRFLQVWYWRKTRSLILCYKHFSSSWEWGAQAEVIFERSYPEYSVYSNTRQLPLSKEDGPLKQPKRLIEFLEPILAKRAQGTLPLVDGDGASGDPASLGVAVLVAAATSDKGKLHSLDLRSDSHSPGTENVICCYLRAVGILSKVGGRAAGLVIAPCAGLEGRRHFSKRQRTTILVRFLSRRGGDTGSLTNTLLIGQTICIWHHHS